MNQPLRMPERVPMPNDGGALPEQVTIFEVGPRDGLQNEKSIVDVAVKAEFIQRLAAAGSAVIEATSFVHPSWVPQLADAEELVRSLAPHRSQLPPMPVLVPNQRGLERALSLGCDRVAVFASATDTFAQRNLNRTFDTQFEMFAPTMSLAKESGAWVRGYISMCWGDPWEGAVAIDRVVEVGLRLLEMGADELSLGDTIGTATPGHVRALLAAFNAGGVGNELIAVHFHDTYGQALANALAALQAGITTLDASAGGLGGCPYAKSATGNLATEDLAWMCEGLGIKTGLNLAALAQTSLWMAEKLGRAPSSRVVQSIAASDD